MEDERPAERDAEKDYSEYNEQKYNFVVGYQKKKAEKAKQASKKPKWVQSLIAWLIAIAMIAMWLLAYAWNLALH